MLYQVYPRSFQDSNGDEIGNLPGMLRRLDYIVSLEVDAIWLSPFLKSPQCDYGYDVADLLRGRSPLFGTIEDFAALIAAVHERGMRVLSDFVPAHTSDQHPWFVENRRVCTGPTADWYVWADLRRNGGPPNNWLSVFGGPAWQWEPRRHQYYCHHFLREQPALNLWNPAVIAALLEAVRFWFARGVDGLRIDAVDYALTDVALRGNPASGIADATSGSVPGSPFGMQRHVFDKARPELGEKLLTPLRHLTAEFPGRVLLGEISDSPSISCMTHSVRRSGRSSRAAIVVGPPCHGALMSRMPDSRKTCPGYP